MVSEEQSLLGVSQANVSQEYFDELCLENHVDFELSQEDAVLETIQQLASSSTICGGGGAGGKKLPLYLILNFPTSPEGIQQRKVNATLKAGIAAIQQEASRDANNGDDDDHRTHLSDTLQTLVDAAIVNQTKRDKTERISRFVLYGGFVACLDLWRQRNSNNVDALFQGGNDDDENLLYVLLLEAFTVEQSTRQAQGGGGGGESAPVFSLEDLQKPLLRLWPTWLYTLENATCADEVESWNVPQLNQLLRLAIFGTRYSEPNKKAFMASKSTESNKSSVSLLLNTLDKLYSTETESPTLHALVGSPVCRLVATLCTYDDFRVAQGAPTVASAHANVQTFHQENAVVRISRYLQEKKQTSAILALRAMAIHDDIVQAMAAVGLLDTCGTLLEHLLSSDATFSNDSGGGDDGSDDSSESTLEALTAVVGLYRNVCANDEIKSKICVGEKSVVRGLLMAMEGHADAAKLQEHACATFAAMALRSPRNAEFLVRHCDAATWIVRAMQKHPSRTTVQRQGALAFRNLVSRSTDLRPVVLQAGAAEALKDIAARHVSCQDEVYAALRDLGLPASILRVEQGANGQLVMKETEMFGERKSGFRPVFD